MRTRIKICGITTVEDAMAAARAGADAIGMVFYAQAGRCIAIDEAQRIVTALPPFVTPVGLFVDPEEGELRETIDRLGLRHVQLHGNEPPELIARLRGKVVLKAIRTEATTIHATLDSWRSASKTLDLSSLGGLILETAGPGVGGTGIDNDWQTIARLRSENAFAGLPPIIAAGGLRPENVAGVIRAIQPWGVDVSSGVEAAPRRKSIAKIEAFVREVRAADLSLDPAVPASQTECKDG